MVPSGHGNGGDSVAGDPDGIGSGFTVIVMHLPLALGTILEDRAAEAVSRLGAAR